MHYLGTLSMIWRWLQLKSTYQSCRVTDTDVKMIYRETNYRKYLLILICFDVMTDDSLILVKNGFRVYVSIQSYPSPIYSFVYHQACGREEDIESCENDPIEMSPERVLPSYFCTTSRSADCLQIGAKRKADLTGIITDLL